MSLNISIEIKFIIFQLLIITPFVIGLLVRKRILNPPGLSKKLIRINLFVNEPVIIIWSVWGLFLKKELSVLPLTGLFMVSLGFVLGRVITRFLNLDNKSKTTFTVCSSISNHGFTLGAFLCYLLVGEVGLGLSSVFILYFTPFVFGFLFPYVQLKDRAKKIDLKKIKEMVLTPQNLPLLSVIIAFTLHGIGIPRPQIFFPIEIFLIILCIIYYFTLGINFEFCNIKSIKSRHLLIAAVKFLAIPVAVYFIMGFSNIDNNMKSVVFIQSFMPAGIYTVVTSILFDLNHKLASSLFIVNTALFIVLILPLLFFLRNFFIF
ncbi:hypothetical protein ACFL20_13180 [Spirochaetota bacterium]